MKLSEIRRSGLNPRMDLEEAHVAVMVEAIRRTEGKLDQRLVLRPRKAGGWDLAIGNYRFEALRRIHGDDWELPEDYYDVREWTDRELARESWDATDYKLSDMEEGHAIEVWMKELGMTEEEIASDFHLTQPRISQRLQLWKDRDRMPDTVKKDLSTSEFSISQLIENSTVPPAPAGPSEPSPSPAAGKGEEENSGVEKKGRGRPKGAKTGKPGRPPKAKPRRKVKEFRLTGDHWMEIRRLPSKGEWDEMAQKVKSNEWRVKDTRAQVKRRLTEIATAKKPKSLPVFQEIRLESIPPAEGEIVLGWFRHLDDSLHLEVARVGDKMGGIGETTRDGQILTRFAKTPHPEKPSDVVCPHFMELKWGTGCRFNCAWCYLQGTLAKMPEGKKPHFKEPSRIGNALTAFFSASEALDLKHEVINAGELCDSLMGEYQAKPFSQYLFDLFGTQTRHRVLLLTKDTKIEHILAAEATKIAIIAFTLNADPVARRWEKGARRVDERIAAAKRVADAGYPVRLRIDPIMPIPEWKDAYHKLIDDIAAAFPQKSNLKRVTIGFPRGLDSTLKNAKDKSWATQLTEDSNWGKRLPHATRLEAASDIVDYLSNCLPKVSVGLCKETVQLWEALGMDWRKIECNCTW